MAMDPQTKALHDCKRILSALDKDEAEAIVLLLSRKFVSPAEPAPAANDGR